MNTASNIPISLDSVDINNFRLFGELTANLHPELTVFIAPNSGGKTAILDAIKLTLESFIQASKISWNIKDSRIVRTNIQGVVSNEKTKDSLISTKVTYQNEYFQQLTNIVAQHSPPGTAHSPVLSIYVSSVDNGKREGFGIPGYDAVSDNITQTIIQDVIIKGESTTLPLVDYFSANRRFGTANNSGDLSNLSRGDAYKTLLTNENDQLDVFVKWLRERAITGLETRLEMEEKGKTETPAPDAHLQAVSTVLALMLEKEVGVKTVKYFSSSKSIQAVKDNGERFDIGQLSHGAKSILTIAAKLAMHCCALNPHLRDKAPALTPGIILIDEIDLHLHPRWQQHVIDDLRRCFPNMQFIISTHSPAVLSTVKKENIREIKVDYKTGKCSATEPLARSYGESIADTLETIMDVSARPDNVLVRKLNDYLNWAENGDLSESRDEQRTELVRELGKDHADLSTADLIIRRREILAENK